MPGAKVALQVPKSLTALLCRHATFTFDRELALASAAVFYAESGDHLYLAGTYDGPMSNEGAEVRVELLAANGRSRISEYPNKDLTWTPGVEGTMLRIPYIIDLGPLPALEETTYMWSLRVGELRVRVPFMVRVPDDSSDDEIV